MATMYCELLKSDKHGQMIFKYCIKPSQKKEFLFCTQGLIFVTVKLAKNFFCTSVMLEKIYAIQSLSSVFRFVNKYFFYPEFLKQKNHILIFLKQHGNHRHEFPIPFKASLQGFSINFRPRCQAFFNGTFKKRQLNGPCKKTLSSREFMVLEALIP